MRGKAMGFAKAQPILRAAGCDCGLRPNRPRLLTDGRDPKLTDETAFAIGLAQASLNNTWIAKDV
jgi:hypothetical protein